MIEWMVILYTAITIPLCIAAAIADCSEPEDGPGEFLAAGLWPIVGLLLLVLVASLTWERLTHSEGGE